MENQNLTPPSDFSFKFLFEPAKYPKAIELAKKEGIEIHFTDDGVYACACFNNTIDYNNFRASI